MEDKREKVFSNNDFCLECGKEKCTGIPIVNGAGEQITQTPSHKCFEDRANPVENKVHCHVYVVQAMVEFDFENMTMEQARARALELASDNKNVAGKYQKPDTNMIVLSFPKDVK